MSAPPPGTNLPSSLPARPPPSSSSRPISAAITAFAPRSVKPQTANTSNTWDVYRPPGSTVQQAQAQYGQNAQYGGYQQGAYDQSYGVAGAQGGYPQAAGAMKQQFQSGGLDPFGNPQYDPEEAAQMAQWQNAYGGAQLPMKTPDNKGPKMGNANLQPLGQRPQATAPQMSAAELTASANADTKVGSVVTGADGKQKTVVRSGGGKTWSDPSLLEWDPSHPRLFVGNLAGEVTDESLHKAFAKYPSIVKARVIRDKRTTKSKGFGFVSFTETDDYFNAAKDMQGKYIGSHPILIKRSTTEIKATVQQPKKHFQKKTAGEQQVKSASTGAGIEKKPPKKKNGLKVLG